MTLYFLLFKTIFQASFLGFVKLFSGNYQLNYIRFTVYFQMNAEKRRKGPIIRNKVVYCIETLLFVCVMFDLSYTY